VEEAQRTRVIDSSAELFQVGIELVQVCTEEICADFKRNKVVENSMRKRSARSASRKTTLGGREVSLVQGII